MRAAERSGTSTFLNLDELICNPIRHAEYWHQLTLIANSFKTFLFFGI